MRGRCMITPKRDNIAGSTPFYSAVFNQMKSVTTIYLLSDQTVDRMPGIECYIHSTFLLSISTFYFLLSTFPLSAFYFTFFFLYTFLSTRQWWRALWGKKKNFQKKFPKSWQKTKQNEKKKSQQHSPFHSGLPREYLAELIAA